MYQSKLLIIELQNPEHLLNRPTAVLGQFEKAMLEGDFDPW
jgi:hypothetical protein